MAQPLRSSNPSFGPDYAVLWRKLEARLLEIRQGFAESLCVADEINKVKVLQGSWGTTGFLINTMREMVAEARGEKTDDFLPQDQ